MTSVCEYCGINKSGITYWKKGKTPSPKMLDKFSNFFGVSVDYFIHDDGIRTSSEYVTFPIIGEVAAGYNRFAEEDWTGDTVDIPVSYLKGRAKSEFFVLRVTGESMYPSYVDGDKVLVLRQETLDHSGQVGVVLYNGETGTLKRVEYADGWMRLVPINPTYPPIKIDGADLQSCKVLGVPKLLIREIEQ